MNKATPGATECPELSKSAAQLRKDRSVEWELLYKREAKALEGDMVAMRKKGRAKLTSDAFGRARQAMATRRSAAYLAAAEAANAAEDAAELAAQKAAEMAVELDDSDNGSTSDVRSPTASPAKKKTRSARGRGRQ